MKVVGWVLAACVAMALLKLAVAVLVLLLAGAGVYALIARPRQALSIFALIVICGMLERAPLVLIVLVAVIMTSCLIGKYLVRDR